MLASAADPVIHPLQLGAASMISGGAMSAAAAAADLYGAMADLGASDAAQAVAADELSPFTLNWFPLKAALSAAPLEFTASAANDAVALPLPMPDGTISWFDVVEAPIMEAGLATKFPDIKTYRGIGIDDPTASVRLDFTPAGFHAQVLSTKGSYYIDPYYRNDSSGTYASYFKRDIVVDAVWRCGVGGSTDVTALSADATLLGDGTSPSGGCGCGACAACRAASGDDSASAIFSDALPAGMEPVSLTYGNDLRTYRAAVAATGEYTSFHGGTVALGQGAVVTAMNRVNQVYETELAIRMVLVANNSSIIYTNSGSDPYSNNNPSALLSQNISNLSSVIGNSNFDIGHVFTTGGGGLAYLGVVGRTNKAGGETGTSSPINDAFTIDYVAHEMGHQFGANHTFNTSNDTGNRNGPTAYEPGSGSTIMAYAGLEGAEDLQPNSDPYFHSASIDEIRGYVTGTIPSVGTLTTTGNTAPTVSAGSDYTIPANTPFTLTASGSDANGDPLTYEWQERDLGAAVLLTTADNGASPLFRDWVPSTSPSRTLPRLSSVLNGTHVTNNASGRPVEKLFQLSRTSNWRVIARDNRPGGGGVTTDDMVLNVVSTGAAFAVTAPNTAVSWTGGTNQTVTWNVAGTTANGINAATVNIMLSVDGGLNYAYTLAAGTANDGSQSITVPAGVGSTQARIAIQPVGNIFFDVSNVNFTVINGTPTPGTISGQTFEDRNADGIFNGNDQPKNGVVVYLDSDNDSILDGGEPHATTSGSGNFSFPSLTAGTYKLREQVPAGYVAVSPVGGAIDVVVNSGATTTQNLFNFPTTYNGTASGDLYTLRKSSGAVTPFYADTFNRATLAGGPFAYTTTVTAGDGGASVILNDLLQLTNDASGTIQASGSVYVTTPTSAFGPFSQNLHANSGPLSWVFNMQQIRPNPSGFASGNYGAAFILGATSSTIPTANGYAVLVGNSGAPDPIRLVRFTGGLNGTTVVIAQDGAQDAGFNYWSVRVAYDPSGDQWSLYTRNDGTGGAVDPTISSGYAQSGVTTVDNVYANTPLTHAGALWNYSSANNQSAKFDNFKLMLDSSPPKIEVLVNGVLTYSALPAIVPSLTFNLEDGADTLMIDETNGSPIPAGGVLFDGGGASDTLELTGTSSADAITVNGSSISFNGSVGVSNTESLVASTGGGADTLSVLTASAAAITFNGGLGVGEIDTLNLTAGAHVFNADANVGTANLVLNVSGAASATFNATQHLKSLTLSGGAAVAMSANGSNMIVTDTLAITGAGSTLDLADNDMIVRAGSLGTWTGSAYDSVTGLIQSGSNGGAWDGDGIVTSLPTSGVSHTTLAVGDGAQLFGLTGSATDMFNGETVSAASVIVKYTYMGDVDADGDIDGDDYFRIDSFVLQSGSTFGYFFGDLNLDGEINGDDYFCLDSEILSQGPPL